MDDDVGAEAPRWPGNVAGIARTQATARPDATAVIAGTGTLTYADVDRRSNQVANALAREGVGPGTPVAMLAKNGLEHFDVLFGASKVGAVPCALNWRLAPTEIQYVLNHLEAPVLVVGDEQLPLVEEITTDLSAVKKVVVVGGDHARYEDYDAWRERSDATDPGAAPAPTDPAFVFYSSGTTGRPKGVVLTNGNCGAALLTFARTLEMGPRSVSHVLMPFFHVAGGLWALTGLAHGATDVVVADVDPARIVDDLRRHGVTHTAIVPTILRALLAALPEDPRDGLPLELVVYGAAPISDELLDAAIARLGCRFMQLYGLTETSGPSSLLTPDDHATLGSHPHRLRSAGRAVPGAEIKVVDDTTLAELEPGTIGEILVRGPNVMEGYLKDPDSTAAAIVEGGFFRTGDVGHLDADGYLYIHDRRSDTIVSGGENIYPAEVENALLAHPAVADAAVVSVPHPTWGETPKAVVVLAPGEQVEPEELIEFARGRLAHYKCPTSVAFVDALPRNASGKVLRRELRDPYWAGHDRRVN